MNIISAEDFNKQTTLGQNRTQKIYQDRILTQGPVFALDKKKLALEYCKSYFKKHSGSYCLVVQERYYFQLWKEEKIIKNPIKVNLESDENISKPLLQNNTLSATEVNKSSLNINIVLDFINLCKKLLSQSIGVFGNFLCDTTLSENPNINCQEFIGILASQIPDVEQSKQFKKTLLQFIDQNIELNTLLKEISACLEEYTEPKDIIANIEIEKVIEKMRNIGGIKIKNRRYKLRIYPNCFIGSEAVEWIVENLNLSTEQAIKLGQRLIDEKFIHHVLDRHDFQNEYLFYRFYWDEK
ncbi:MAG: hypothetical protein QNJ60_12665 [Xenococcaceae cyanobacterium MO_188.B19]|nr:hypothetical protein [Xenococcaceae cyanobacterium MO_188.B19]